MRIEMLYDSTMAEPAGKPRRWFRFHLSTEVNLFLGAAVLGWANLARKEVHYGRSVDLFRAPDLLYVRGWPCTFEGNVNETGIRDFIWLDKLAINIITALAILAAVAAISEIWIRLRLHLSTALTVMFAAFGLLWANFLEHRIYPGPYGYGCPFIYSHWNNSDDVFHWFGLLADIAVSLVILSAVTVLVEFRCRSVKWFQFRLSTAMALMIAASVLVWANVVERSEYAPQYSLRGWPFQFVWSEGQLILGSISSEWPNLVGDLFFAVTVLAVVATACEILVREKKHG